MDTVNRLLLVILFALAVWQYRGMRRMGYSWVTSFLVIFAVFAVVGTVVLGLAGFIVTGTWSW